MEDVLMRLIRNTTVLKATSLLSQCESLSVGRSADMCTVYFTGNDTTAERSSEREENCCVTETKQLCVCDLRQPCRELATSVCTFKPHQVAFKGTPARASTVILSQDVRHRPQLLTYATPQPQQRLQLEVQDVNGFLTDTQMNFTPRVHKSRRLTCSTLTLQKYFLSASFGSVSLV